MFLPCKPAAIPPTRPLGQPGGRSDHDHPPVAALTEWGPPLRGGRLPTGGQSIKLMPSLPAKLSLLLWEAHSYARSPDQPGNLSTLLLCRGFTKTVCSDFNSISLPS